MILHILFGKHSADLMSSRWDSGRFVSTCTVCGREMIKPPGGAWGIVPRQRPR